MQRYFVKNIDCTETTVRIGGADFHHIKHVMRMKPGEEASVVDEHGRVRLVALSSYVDDAALFAFVAELPGEPAGPRIAIAQALIRKDRFELMLEKATELGASEIIPTAFSRSVVKFDAADEPRKVERFRLIAKEAAEQSKRSSIPAIAPVTALKDLPFAVYDRVFVCFEAATPDDHLGRLLKADDFRKRLLFIIGPEGGIAPEELAFLQAKGAVVCALGSRVLRSETASMYLLSAIDSLWEAAK